MHLSPLASIRVYTDLVIQPLDHTLPSIILFLHSHRLGSWHIDTPGNDNVLSVKRLNLTYVAERGFVNLRCQHYPGCPEHIRPFRNTTDERTNFELAMPDTWHELFGNFDVPEVIGAPCCAQFAVSREQVHKRPPREYQRFLRWLELTPMDNWHSGVTIEYLWHVIFGMEPVHCPEVEECYRKVYGVEVRQEDWESGIGDEDEGLLDPDLDKM